MPTLHSNNPVPSNGSVATVIRGVKSISMTLSGVGAVRAVVQIMAHEDGAAPGPIGSQIVVSGTTTVTATQTFNAEAGQVYLQLVDITPACKFSATLTELGPIQDTNPGYPTSPFASTAERNASYASVLPSAHARVWAGGVEYEWIGTDSAETDADWGVTTTPIVDVIPATFIAPSLVRKSGMKTFIWSSEVASYIPFDSTSGSGQFRVRWLDYTGAVVYSVRVNAGASLSAPTAPDHTAIGLTFDSWSQSALMINADTDIIANYYATDGKTHVFLDASALAGNTPTVKVVKSDTSTLTIEWGDGTTSTSSASGNVTLVKPVAYADGRWEMRASITSGAGTFTAGLGTVTNQFIAGVAVTEMWMRSVSASVSDYAFNGTAFRTMKYVTGMGNVTSIGTYAFQYCYALVSVSMPLATSIGTSAFQYCRLLASAVIGPDCTLIDTLAFDGCRNLISLTVEATTPPTLASVATIADYDPRMWIYVPSASVTAYKTATNWSAFSARIVGY